MKDFNERLDLHFAKAVAQSNLSGVQKGILQYSRIWWKKDEGCHIFESYENWANNCGINEKTLRNNIKVLEELGWLVRTGKTYAVAKGRPVIEYRLAFGKNHGQTASDSKQTESSSEQTESSSEQTERSTDKSIGIFSSLEESVIKKEESKEVRDDDKDKTAAKAAHQSSLTSDEDTPLDSNNDEASLTNEEVGFLDQTEKGSAAEQTAFSSVIEKEVVSAMKLYENGVFRDKTNEEAWKLIEDVYPTLGIDKQFGYVRRIMNEVGTSGGSVDEIANRLGYKRLVAAIEW